MFQDTVDVIRFFALAHVVEYTPDEIFVNCFRVDGVRTDRGTFGSTAEQAAQRSCESADQLVKYDLLDVVL